MPIFKKTTPKTEKASKTDLGGLQSVLDASYESNENAEKILKRKGYTLDKDLSGERAKVFTDKAGNPHVVYRGTQNRHDVATDALLMVGLGAHTNRIKHTKKIQKQAAKKYGKPVNAYGHSLGGYLAENSGAKGKITTFNKASNGTKVKNNRQTDVRTHTDLVSLLTPKTGTKKVVIKGSLDPLKSHSVDALKRTR